MLTLTEEDKRLWNELRTYNSNPKQGQMAFFSADFGQIDCGQCLARLLYDEAICDQCRYNKSE